MAEVKFAEYMQYLEQRQRINSAVMALLAGSQLAHHTLQLTEGSSRPLRDIFPKVPHIDRFNLASDTARGLLVHAESHLSAMAIPYILALQESLFGTFESMLVRAGQLTPRSNYRKSPIWIIKEKWELSSQPLDMRSWHLFELLNELRNDIVHRAGVIGDSLIERVSTMDRDTKDIWESMAKKPFPSFVVGEKHEFDHAEMVACLAVTKFLAKEGNEIMQRCYPRELWISDLIDEAKIKRGARGNLNQRLRKARSRARLYYSPLGLSATELEAEILKEE